MQKAKNKGQRAKGKELRAKNSMLVVLYILLIALCSMLYAVQGNAAQKGPKETIALFPFENFSEDRNALPMVMSLIRNKLEEKGFEVLDDDSLNKFLLKERIRSTGYISKDIAGKIGEELNVKAIMVGSVNSFTSGENPCVGFSARLVDSSDGAILWAKHVSATGEDFTTILGLGRIKTVEKLTYKVMDKLLGSFSTIPPAKEKESTYRIAVMPFQNKSKMKDVGMIATYMFIDELFKNKKFVPLEYGDVRFLVVNLRIRDKGELDFEKTEAISRTLGVDGIIVGTVEVYKEGEGTAPPEASISARLIDAHKNKILWSDYGQMKGDDDIFMLDWGRIYSAESVSYKAIANLVKRMGKTKWR